MATTSTTHRASRRTAVAVGCSLLIGASVTALRSPAATAQPGYPPGTVFFVGADDTTVSTVSAGTPGDPIGTDLSSPRGLAVDSSGRVYVAATGTGQILRLDPDGSTAELAGGLSAPTDVAVDDAGNVLAADADGIVLIGADGPTQIAAGFLQPVAVAVAPSGHLLVADAGANEVVDVAPDGTRTTVGDGLSAPRGVAVADDGTVLIADTGNDRVLAVDPTGAEQTLGSGLLGPAAVAAGGAGTVYVADTGNNRLVQIAPDGAQSALSDAPAIAVATYVAAQEIDFTSSVPATAAVGGTYVASATGGASGQPVVFSADATSVGCIVTADGTVTFTAVGTCHVVAHQAGSADYRAAPGAQQTIDVGPGSQTVTFTSSVPTDAAVGGTYLATATGGGSGMPMVFTAGVGTVACTVDPDGTVTFVHVGTCEVDADQGGDTNWDPAPQAEQSFDIAQGGQTITFTSGTPDAAVVGGSYVPTATGGASGAPVVFSVDPTSTACSIDTDGLVSFDHAGACIVLADQVGDADWTPADEGQQSFAIGRRTGTLVFASSPPSEPVVGQTYTATATGEGPVEFSADPTSTGCTVASDGTVALIGVGTCVVDAAQAGSDDVEAATAQQTFDIGPGPQVVVFLSTPPASAAVGSTYLASARGGASGNPVLFTADPASTGCTVAADGTVRFTAVGTCVVDADQAGTVDYDPAERVQQAMPVAKGAQNIVFSSAPPVNPVVGAIYVAMASGGGSGKPVTFAAQKGSPSVCTVTPYGLVRFVGIGACRVAASQAGTASYLKAADVTQVLHARLGQTITFAPEPAWQAVGGKYAPAPTGGASGTPVVLSVLAGSPVACRLNHGNVSFVARGSCTVVATQTGTTNYAPATAREVLTVYARGSQSPIKHVVLLFQENHSFDETLGAYCATRANPCDGDVGPVRLKDGTVIPMTHSPDVVPQVDHRVAAQVQAMDDGAMDGWGQIGGCSTRAHQCLTYYLPSDIPNLATLADHFVVSDRTFSLADSPSWGGHLYAAAATLDGFTGANPQPAPGVATGPGWGCDSFRTTDWAPAPGAATEKVPSCVPDADGTGPYTVSPVTHVSTIFDELQVKGLPWKIYGATKDDGNGGNEAVGGYGWSICPSFADCLYTPQVNNLVPTPDVLTDAADGTLPAYSVVTPSQASAQVMGTATSQHNGSSMLAGDDWIGRIVSAIENGPDWNSTAVFITYDDCGCFYDHVPPPLNPDGTRQGIRLPTVIVSPYAKPGYTDSQNASLASILAFAERTLGLPALSPNDAAAYGYAQSFDFSAAPRSGVVLHQSRVPKASIAYAKAHPDDDDPT